MVVDFSAIQYDEPPLLVLKNLDGTPIQSLGYAFGLHAHLCYNEMSEISFSLPAYVDGQKTPRYDDVVGLRIIDWIGVGQFILIEPERDGDGVKEIKSCKAYSLEYEFNHKKIFLPDGTYNFWNPASPDNTVLSMIVEVMPSWSIGSVDAVLIGKYRTFSTSDQTVYNFIKSDLQETYQCIFDFDTYNRKINVRSVESAVSVQPIYLSFDNLVKEIKVTENTENVYTCLDVNGADNVDIRSVNPMGTNKIYNLDYFMNDTYFPADIVQKWQRWKETYNGYQQAYFDLTVEKVLAEARLAAQKAELVELNNKRDEYEVLRSTYVEAAGQGVDRSDELAEIKAKLAEQDDKIDSQETKISRTQAKIDAYYKDQRVINSECSFSSFFTADEQKILDRYVREDSISESSFVYRDIVTYSDKDVSTTPAKSTVTISDAKITGTIKADKKHVYSIVGGVINMKVDADAISADIVRGAVEKEKDGSFTMTAYLNAGEYANKDFTGGCVSIIGTVDSFKSDVEVDEDIEGTYVEGSSFSTQSSDAQFYFTYNVNEYAKRSIEWDLFEYGQQCLEEVCWPTYSFSIGSANFLACDDFLAFKNKFKLGDKVYLDCLSTTSPLTPIVVGAEFDMDDPTSFELEFGDTYSLSDSAFKLVDLLDNAVTMGKTVSTSRVTYSAFKDGGYDNKVNSIIQDALDVSKNKVLSSTGQAMDWGPYGMRFRRETADGTYGPCQMWAINDGLYMTDDDWTSVKLAIGRIGDNYGVVADNLFGHLVATNNLVVESGKQSNGTSIFRVDGDGAKLYNADFDLVSKYSTGNASYVGQIGLHPTVGLTVGNASGENAYFEYDNDGNIIGVKTVNGSSLLDLSRLDSDDTPLANFWCDMYGNVFLKGKVIATDGSFSGTVHAKAGDFTGTVNAKDLQLDGKSISNIFKATTDDSGNDILKIGQITIDGTTGEVTWTSDTNPVQSQFSVSGTGSWHDDMRDGDYYRRDYDWDSKAWGSAYQFRGTDGSDASVPSYIKRSYIGATEIRSPTFKGNNVEIYGAYKVLSANDTVQGYMGAATGMDSTGGVTAGVALASSATVSGDAESGITYATAGNYVIATSGGCRMQAGNNSVIVTANGASMEYGGTAKLRVDANGCRYTTDGSTWQNIGSGGGSSTTVVARWG